nr:hypothetical protein [Tanacetum cinerariifolium]
MAAPERGNQVARRVVDDLLAYSGDTSVQGYMKFYKAQQLAETRLFFNRMREEAQTARNMIAQLNALIAKMEAFEDQKEVFDTLMGLRDDMRVEETKLMRLNDLVTQGEEDIEIKEAQLEDKIKVVLSQARSADESFIELMRSLCVGLRLSLNKHHRLIAELEALGQHGDVLSQVGMRLKAGYVANMDEADLLPFVVLVNALRSAEYCKFVDLEALGAKADAVRALGNMREIVSRDAATLGVLEQLLAGTHVAMRLKDGYMA